MFAFPNARRPKRHAPPVVDAPQIAIDNGASELRAGYAEEATPSLRFPNQLIRPRARWSTEFETVVGESHFNVKGFDFGRAAVRSPFDANVVVNFDTQEAILDYTFDRLGFEGPMAQTQLVMTECLLNPGYSRKTMAELLFEAYGLASVVFVPDCLAAYYNCQSMGRCGRNCVVLHSGHSATHVIPFLDGQARLQYAQRSKICGQSYLVCDVTGDLSVGSQATQHLQQLLMIHNPQCSASLNKQVVEMLKEQFVVCSQDYLLDLRRISEGSEAAEALGRKIQLPKSIAAGPAVQESPTDKEANRATKAEEQRLRLKAMSMKRKQKLISEKEDLLVYYRDIHQQISKANSEDLVAALLEDAGVNDVDELLQSVDTTAASLQRLRRTESPAAQATPSDAPVQTADEIDSLRERYQAILERLENRKRSRAGQDSSVGPSKRVSSAQRRRMKLVAEAAAHDDADDFGADDRDWDVYKEMDPETSSISELNRRDEAELRELREKLHHMGQEVEEPKHVELGHPQLMGQLDESHVYLSVERLRVPELLFQPSLAGIDQAGVHEIVARVLASLPRELRAQVDQELLLSGGNAAYQGLPSRLEAEMQCLRPLGRPMKIREAKDFFLDAWRGAAKFLMSPQHAEFGISLAEYEEMGSEALSRKRIPFVAYL